MWIRVYEKEIGAKGTDLEVISDYTIKYINSNKIRGFEIEETDDFIYHICLDLGMDSMVEETRDEIGRVQQTTIQPPEYYYAQADTQPAILKKADALAEMLDKGFAF